MTPQAALRALVLATPHVGDAGSPERAEYVAAVDAVTRALAEREATSVRVGLEQAAQYVADHAGDFFDGYRMAKAIRLLSTPEAPRGR